MSLLHLAVAYFRSRALLAFSALAIALGVAVLFTVLAVFNGFLQEVERTLREFGGDGVVQAPPGGRAEPPLERVLAALAEVDGLAEARPRLNYFGLTGRRGARALDDPRTTDLSGLLLVGVDEIPPGLTRVDGGGSLAGRPVPPGGIFLGRVHAEKLGVAPGEEIEVVSFRRGSLGRPVPVRAAFRVAAVFTTGRYDLDQDRALVSRADLARMVGHAAGWSEITLVGEPGVTPEVLCRRAETVLDRNLAADGWRGRVRSWRQQGGNFLKAVENQKGVLTAVFFFIVVVAAFQLIATLSLTVAEKRLDIGVLGALGASPGRIVTFFISLGLVIAAAGSALGLLLGRWLTGNLEWVQERLFGQRIFNAETYIFSRIPVAVDWASVAALIAATLGAALVFSFLPAWLAARREIVAALRR
ncbi:MAG: ABC transporter permease [Planctomycetota bacterium]|nr:MAG: ABC transporter permease [Planctomycetota bacterium]